MLRSVVAKLVTELMDLSEFTFRLIFCINPVSNLADSNQTFQAEQCTRM